MKPAVGPRKELAVVFLIFLFLSLALFFDKFPWAGPSQTFIDNDFNSYYLNWHYLAKKLTAGVIPHWIPYESLGGQPFIGNGFATLYPPHFVGYLLYYLFRPGEQALFIFLGELVAHFALGGFFAYLFFRRVLKLRVWPSLLGGVVFIFNPIFMTFAEAPAHLFSTIWLPLILYNLTQFLARRSWINLYGAGLGLGLSLLGGYPYNSALIFLFTSAWGLFWQLTPAGGRVRRKLSLLSLSLLLIGLVGLGVWGVEMLPGKLLVEKSSLGDPYTYTGSSRFALQFSELDNFLFPFNYLHDGSVYKYCYVGWTIWWLIALAFSQVRSNRIFRFFLGASCLTLLIPLGDNTVLHRFFYLLLSSVTFFRRPSVALFLFSFAVAGLAALSAHHLDFKKINWSRQVNYLYPLFLVIFAALIYLRTLPQAESLTGGLIFSSLFFFFGLLLVGLGKIWPQIAKIGLLVVVVAQLFSLSSKIPQFSLEEGDQRKLFQENQIIEFLRENTADGSRVNLSSSLMARYLGGFFNLNHVWGYEAFHPFEISTLYRRNDFTKNLASEEVQHWLKLTGVKYVVSPAFLNTPAYRLVTEYVIPEEERFSFSFQTANKLNRPALAGEKVYLYQVEGALPRAYLVDTLIVKDHLKAEDLSLIGNLGQQAVVEASQPLPDVLEGVRPSLEGWEGAVRSLVTEDNRVTIRTWSSKPAFLVLSDTYYPDWQVKVNGRSSQIWKTNYYLRGVVVPAGESEVIFTYRPRLFWWGLGFFLLTVGGGFLICFLKPGLRVVRQVLRCLRLHGKAFLGEALCR